MTGVLAPPDAGEQQNAAPASRPAPVTRAFGFELTKLGSLWRIRVVLIACLIAPALFVAVVSRQSSLPSDTVFGRWMHASGWAGVLVVLGFCCSWALPLLVSLVAGDVFAAEDRLGTWRHLLMAVRSPRRIFVVKSLASLLVILVMVVALAGSAIVGGMLAVGNHPLVGLSGQSLTPGQTATRVLLAWLAVLVPTLAFAGVGLLGSIVLGRSPMGLLLPAVLALVLQLAQLLPLPVVLRLALPSSAFVTWHGLFTDPVQRGPLLIGIVVALAWAVLATALAYLLFVRRDFTDLARDGSGRRAVVVAVLPLAAMVGVAAALIGLLTPASGSGIERVKLQDSVATSFGHLYRTQLAELHRPDATEAQLRTSASCDKGGGMVADRGPGNDWRCVVRWRVPGSTVTGVAIYQLDVTSDGRYVADGDGPKEVNGFFVVRTDRGNAPNPLWQFDGSVDLLHPTQKGIRQHAGNATTP